VSFRGSLRGCEYCIWATNARKITRKDTPDPLFRFPKSSFGRHKIDTILPRAWVKVIIIWMIALPQTCGHFGEFVKCLNYILMLTKRRFWMAERTFEKLYTDFDRHIVMISPSCDFDTHIIMISSSYDFDRHIIVISPSCDFDKQHIIMISSTETACENRRRFTTHDRTVQRPKNCAISRPPKRVVFGYSHWAKIAQPLLNHFCI